MFFTTLDLASGYWQIELEDSAKEKTAFIVQNNLYQFKRMAFGLCNAPATFQRTMNYVLRDVLGKKALVNLDEVIIFSDTFEAHLEDIREVFNLLKIANLKLKLKKCQFIKHSVNYLSHIISKEGIAQDPEKIYKILNYPVPQSADDNRSFLGLAGYYRRFIKGFDNGELTDEHQINNPVWVQEMEFYQVIDGVLYHKDFSTKIRKRNEVKLQAILTIKERTSKSKIIIIGHI
ncbi:Uncharacterized protein APZ42_012510 [Daphnia magna]|uniref:Reverse transcriptase domain-containing protein n=1 Tax=Daphnia magna TaxID=35525 RepID=A0A162RR19_9CRUS|nr:Uncharacterized protein APZ42_012510 [Daphnia magna]